MNPDIMINNYNYESGYHDSCFIAAIRCAGAVMSLRPCSLSTLVFYGQLIILLFKSYTEVT